MKTNKKYVIIAIIIFIIVIITVVFIANNKNKVDKFTLCDIVTYDEVKIDEYNTNKLPFKIVNYDKDAKIFINGELYENNKRLYKPGKYKIEISLNNKIEKAVVEIKNVDINSRNEYNIYITAHTLPTFLASFNIIKQKDIPSYIWFQRENTLNIEEIKNTLNNVKISEYIGVEKIDEIIQKVIPEIKNYVKEILKKDENAHFNVYITGEEYWIEIPTLEGLGLTEERVDITMLSCGTIDYVSKYNIQNDDSYEILEKEKIILDDAINQYRSDLYKININSNESAKGEINEFILINSLRKNTKYFLQYPELLTYKDEKVRDEMKNANIKKIAAKEEYSELTEEERNAFFKLINLNKNEFDKKYFNAENEKYLIITGTRPFLERYSVSEFENMIDQVIEKYEEKYTILYKPHPVAIPNEQEEKILQNKNIKILPGKMPIEAIMLMYDVNLGGFGSSLYLSAEKGETLFFFAENKKYLVSPLDELYDSLFENVEFIIPKK